MSEQLQHLDNTYHLHPFTDHKSLRTQGSKIITKADGCYIWDSEGNKLLDGMAGLWCVNVGYGRKRLCDAAYQQLNELPYYNSFFKTSNRPAIELSAKLAEISPPGLAEVFFGSSGSESVDTMIRMVRHYWALENQPQRNVIISRQNAYHGSTVAGASLGGMTAMHKQLNPPLGGFEHVIAPYWYGANTELSPDDFGIEAANAIEQRIREVGPDKVAAVVGEPIQGAGGVKIPPQTYWPRVQEICERYDILLVADEVITGFGRLGQWFGSTHFDIKPDLVTFAKGVTSGYVPLSGVLVGERVRNTLVEKGGEFFHGYTYSGHPVSCAVALENLKIIEEENLLERVREDTGPYLAERLATLREHDIVGETRSVGLMAAVELVKDKKTHGRYPGDGHAGEICRDFCFEHNFIMRAVGDTMVMAPPLIISRDQIDELVAKLGEVLDLTLASLRP